MKFRPILILIILLAFLSAGFYLTGIFHQHAKASVLPVYNDITEFQLTDSTQKKVTLNDLKGKVWIADFIFTTCGGICPVMSKNMASLHRSYNLMSDVAFVSISVNPDTDTPEVLAAYAKKLKADTSKWHFLTGSSDEIRDIAVKSFKLGSMEEPIFHSGYFTLVDRKARIRGYYDGTQQKDVEKLFKDIAHLLKEK